jgi:hypothetical protein
MADDYCDRRAAWRASNCAELHPLPSWNIAADAVRMCSPGDPDKTPEFSPDAMALHVLDMERAAEESERRQGLRAPSSFPKRPAALVVEPHE